jgi:hypothetical protein
MLKTRHFAYSGAVQHFSLKRLNRLAYPLGAPQQKGRPWEDAHIQEFDMWSYTEAENAWLASSRQAARLTLRADAPDQAA